MCRQLLFYDVHVLGSEGGEITHTSEAGACKPYRRKKKNDIQSHLKDACTSIFVEPMAWMGDLSDGSGRLKCGRCGHKLGSWCWHGLQCSCGVWKSPAFQIHFSKIDKEAVGEPSGYRGEAVPVFVEEQQKTVT
eukprot:GHVQ01006078.1.p1 GENE.GHVQ01006078.1~~GHVQ01006078.1.p1  ORF type:complete len:134 (+),score=18.80 GHVQ01006078.1:163-564(+)